MSSRNSSGTLKKRSHAEDSMLAVAKQKCGNWL